MDCAQSKHRTVVRIWHYYNICHSKKLVYFRIIIFVKIQIIDLITICFPIYIFI